MQWVRPGLRSFATSLSKLIAQGVGGSLGLLLPGHKCDDERKSRSKSKSDGDDVS